jgi:FkbM family methyltransferase
MYIKFILKIISFFDYFKKKDVINFFKKNITGDIINLIDVGAHHGETIKLFNSKFNIHNIYAFEPSYKNFKILEKKTKNIKNTNLKIYNYGIGETEGLFDFNESDESQSSTLVKINYNSKYYKRKKNLLRFFKKEQDLFFTTKVNIKTLGNFLKNQKIDNVEILKIDTEGYDFNVIKSLENNLSLIKYIYFEHHFHNMLRKDYTFTQIHNFLINNGFKKAFKTKMFYRKTFEYIYKNSNIKYK